MKKISKIALITAMAMSLTGCWNRRELNTLGIVMGVGIDEGVKLGNIKVTAQLVDTNNMESAAKTGDSQGSAYINLTEEGKDIMSIFRGFTHEISRKLYIPHNQIIIFGEDMAEQGVHDVLDFFMRDHESRLTVNVFVAKGKAADILKCTPQFSKIPAIDISQLVEAQGATSETATVNLFEFMGCLASKTRDVLAPMVELKDQNGKMVAYVSGGAVFKEDKMVGQLDKDQTRAFLWVMGKVKSGIVIDEIKAETVTIEIMKASSDVKVELGGDGSIKAKIKIKQLSSIASQTGAENLGSKENLELVKSETEKIIKEQVEAVVKKSQELGADIFGFGEKIHQTNPKAWKKLEGEWDGLYKNIKVEVEANVKIVGMGRLSKPDYPEPKEKEQGK
ncbi:MAG: Ger(x)C family spore germination protein [Oscillospiraceae bacterium]|nr:Ger(x)C family spore germination protein [Oscillospiraceae bacterium]